MKEKITLVVLGAGNRGTVYSNYALERSDICQVVAVCEPIPARLEAIATRHNIPKEAQYTHAVVVTTLDQDHVEPAIAFANLKYDILLEKPMAPTAEECKRIVKAVVDNQVILGVGHVLRYTPYTQQIKKIVDSGQLGNIVNIQHLEPVGWFHAAHSYVRGNWRNTKESSFMLLAKSCHDIDWIMYITGKQCRSLSSFGSLNHFRPENKPVGAASRCLACPVEADCPYSAKKIYLDRAHEGPVWPLHVLTPNVNPETIRQALETGPYGRCVYECDNDVVDNQVVNFQFADGTTASFTMVAYSEEICVRKTRIFGTRGELVADGHTIEVFDFNSQKKTVYNPERDLPEPATKLRGHNFADYYFMSSWVEAVRTSDQSKLYTFNNIWSRSATADVRFSRVQQTFLLDWKVLSGPMETLASHLIVFEAERARLENQVVPFKLNLDW